MKKYISIVCALLLGAFASCSQSEPGDETPQTKQTILKVVADDGLQTRTAATGVDNFAIEVYTDAAYTTAANVFADGSNKATNATGQFAMILDRTQEYYCLLWANRGGSTAYGLNSLKAVALTGKATEAWHGTKTIAAGADAALTATLTHAVSKITLLETGKLKAGTVKLNFDQSTAFNVADGTTSGTATARPEETVTIAADVNGSITPAKLNTADIFVLSSIATADVTNLTLQYASEEAFTVSNVPLKANFNTNIKGHYSTAKAGPTFTVTCDGEWETEENDKVFPTPNFIEVNGLKWAVGSLVADGKGGCKIGTATDSGLFFQFGSLVGWSSEEPLAIAVKPITCTVQETWNSSWTGADDPSADPNAKDEEAGTGDPCRYYLGGTWRLPTNAEFVTLFEGNSYPDTEPWIWDDNTKSASHTSGLKFLAAGARFSEFGGSLRNAGSYGYYWSASPPSDESRGYYISFGSTNVTSNGSTFRKHGFPARCVRD